MFQSTAAARATQLKPHIRHLDTLGDYFSLRNKRHGQTTYAHVTTGKPRPTSPGGRGLPLRLSVSETPTAAKTYQGTGITSPTSAPHYLTLSRSARWSGRRWRAGTCLVSPPTPSPRQSRRVCRQDTCRLLPSVSRKRPLGRGLPPGLPLLPAATCQHQGAEGSV